MKSTDLSVSMVIPAYNEEAVITDCVEAVLNQTVPADEILVVDNNSTDKTAAIVTRLQKQYPDGHICLLHETKEQGIVPARNHGFNAASGDVIGRIDADSIIDKNWVAEVKRLFGDNPGLAAATGPVIYHDMPFRELGLRTDNTLREFMTKLAPKYRLLFGSNMAIRKSAWQVVKKDTARDKDNRLHEDIDLGLCLTEAGFELQYSPKMIGSMSARRLENSPADFRRYVKRFDNTYNYHGIKDPSLRAPILLYLAIYFPGKALRRIYAIRHKTLKEPKMPA